MLVTIRLRSVVWFTTGLALALVVAVVTFGDAWRADASPGDLDSTYVPITACRLVDTRPAPLRVGPLSAWGTSETKVIQATGANGNCSIPAEAIGLSMNVTALNATSGSFLTFWPDGDLPLAASLNPSPGQPPVPNAVTTQLSSTGAFSVYNERGSVDIVIDVNGYYVATSLADLHARMSALESTVSALDGLDERVASVETAVAGLDGLDSRLGTLESTVGEVYYEDDAPNRSLTATTEIVATVTVDAKAAGRVVVTASGYTDFGSSGFDSATCSISEEVTAIEADVAVVVNDSAATGSSQALPFSATRAFPVSPGATDFHLVCRENSGTVSFYNPLIVAEFGVVPGS